MLWIIPFINSPTSPFADNRMINLGVSQEFPQACQLIAVLVYLLALTQEMKLMSAAQNYNINIPFKMLKRS